MIQNVVVLLPAVVDNGFVSYSNGVNALNLDVRQTREHFDCVDHVCNFLQPLAKSVKLTKDVILTVKNKCAGYTYCLHVGC